MEKGSGETSMDGGREGATVKAERWSIRQSNQGMQSWSRGVDKRGLTDEPTEKEGAVTGMTSIRQRGRQPVNLVPKARGWRLEIIGEAHFKCSGWVAVPAVCRGGDPP